MTENSAKILTAVIIILLTINIRCAEDRDEFEFRGLLGGLMADNSPEESRALKEEISKTLLGREVEVWNFVRTSIEDETGVYSNADISVGFRGLHLIDGYKDEILDELLEILRDEASNFASFEALVARRDRREITYSDDEFERLLKRETIIGFGFDLFEIYRDGLPREISAVYLRSNDSWIRARAIKWYRLRGKEMDIPLLLERTDELRTQEANNAVKDIEDAISTIRSRPTKAQSRESDERSKEAN